MPSPDAGAPRSALFRREREAGWRELESLVDKVERGGLRSLSAAELHRLPTLYRAAVSALAVARATILDKALLDYLTALVGRAYMCVYASRRHPLDEIADFFLRRFPQTVRKNWILIAVAALLVVSGVATGWWVTASDPANYWGLVPDEMMQGRDPTADTEALRKVLYSDGGGTVSMLNLFASFLFTHNSKIAILCFALGFAAGAPCVYLLFYNGLSLGAMAALYQQHGLGVEFWAWILPHGVTELTSVVLSGAAGLALGLALVFPGRHTRLENLALRGKEVATIAIGAVSMLFVAAIFEGFFRQLVPSVPIRYATAAVMATWWIFYFGFVGREKKEARK